MKVFVENEAGSKIKNIHDEKTLAFDDEARKTLTDFVHHVFDHISGKHIRAGGFLDREVATAWITAHQDSPPRR